jgi:hypothetical protein
VSWTRQITAYLKSLDPNHLVLDGVQKNVLSEASLTDPNVDLVQTHHYEKDPRQMIDHIKRSAAKAKGKKPYHLGEFGFLSTAALKAVMNTIIEDSLVGGLLWSLRYHNRDGGFYWHHEPAGGDLFKAYHWPGFNIGELYDERTLMQTIREKAFEIRGLSVPPLPRPEPPQLLPIESVNFLNWRGSVGANCYDVERAESQNGPWFIIGKDISDARVQYRPLFCDEKTELGKEYFYRVRAINSVGSSDVSNIVGPVKANYLTLLDEFWNDSKIFLKRGKIKIENNQARRFREDCFRLSGEKGSYVIYFLSQPFHRIRLFAFSKADTNDFELSFSENGKDFSEVDFDKKAFTSAEDNYGYWSPILYTFQNKSNNQQYLKILFNTDAQISRIEIDYGKIPISDIQRERSE